MVGAIAANLQEGSRSEYLAQYIFASFGTVISVPHQEDSGIDLYCTLTERVGARAYPKSYFSVQVKSTMDPWVFEGKQAVKWVLEHPVPIFLCVVDKSSARLLLYQTSPRFFAWSLPPLPDRLELVPTMEERGQAARWEDATRFSLGAPILNASVADLLNDEFHARAEGVLKSWIGYEVANLKRFRSGIREFSMPGEYTPNNIGAGGVVTHGTNRDPDIGPLLEHVRECMAYLSVQLQQRKDLQGGARCALWLRHFFKDSRSGTHLPFLHQDINDLLGKGEKASYLSWGVDTLNEWLDQKLK